MPFFKSSPALYLEGLLPNRFCRSAHRKETKGRIMPFRFLLTMEKLQLYKHQKFCYDALVLGDARRTGQERPACRDVILWAK